MQLSIKLDHAQTRLHAVADYIILIDIPDYAPTIATSFGQTTE